MTMRSLMIAACAALGACASAGDATVYERYEQLAADPAFTAALEAPAARVQDLAWMVGEWRVAATVFATAATPESTEEMSVTFRMVGDAMIASEDLSTVLVYDGFARHWVSFGAEPPAAPFNSGIGVWDGRQLVVESEARIFGETFRLRQTVTKVSEDRFDLLNEQLMRDGRYRRVDAYVYTRTRS